MNKIKREDTVLVIGGKDRGKQGTVRTVLAREGRIIVQGVNIVKRHQKPKAQGTQAGIIEKEAPQADARGLQPPPRRPESAYLPQVRPVHRLRGICCHRD
jgi:hypothetical protein